MIKGSYVRMLYWALLLSDFSFGYYFRAGLRAAQPEKARD